MDQRYPRWSIIEANIERNPKDNRHESFRIDETSIRVIRRIDTKNNWEERKRLLLPLLSNSIDEIQLQGASLGLIKPQSIYCPFDAPTKRDWSPKQKAILEQEDLFEESFDLDKIPYKFGCDFIDLGGKRHRYSTSDWEISQLYRKMYENALNKGESKDNSEKEALEKVRQKLNSFLERDLYFIVGNLQTKPKTFMAIGLFYPPRVSVEQLSLFQNK
jgi:hypothetical protein